MIGVDSLPKRHYTCSLGDVCYILKVLVFEYESDNNINDRSCNVNYASFSVLINLC